MRKPPRVTAKGLGRACRLTLMYRFNDPLRSVWERWVAEDDAIVEQERKRARLERGDPE